ncbi:hypothetical protein EIP86_007783 [Pleurotus ostreatoroseus]|nr:hypothetical protein EIP86_007783 [Pleurotus ostreatoroseus]
MAILFTLYTDFPSFQKAEQWLDMQINLLLPDSNLVRWPSTVIDPDGLAYAGGATIYSPSPTDVSSPEICRALDTRYQRIHEAHRGGCDKVFVMKNGSRAYTSHHMRDVFHEIPILFSLENPDGEDTDDERACIQRFAKIDEHDENPFQIDAIQSAMWEKDRIVDVAGLCGDILILQNVLRALIADNLNEYGLGGTIAPASLTPTMYPSFIKRVVIVCGLAASGKSSVVSYLHKAFSEEKERPNPSSVLAEHSLGLHGGRDWLTPVQFATILTTVLELFGKLTFRTKYDLVILDWVEGSAALRLAKEILGPLLRIIYVDTEEPTRIERARLRAETDDSDEKDLRIAEYAFMIEGPDMRNLDGPHLRELADVVLDNNGLLTKTLTDLQDYLSLHPLVSQD